MAIPTYILFALAVLGGADVVMYHIVSHGIRHHLDSRGELVTHSLRGPIYFLLFILVPNFVLYGAWFWFLVGILIADVVVSVFDFALEGASRRKLGGLPPGEYVLHILLAILFGALAASIGYSAGGWAEAPTTLAYDPSAVPWAIRLALGLAAVTVLYSGALDVLAVVRLGKEQRTAHASERAGK